MKKVLSFLSFLLVVSPVKAIIVGAETYLDKSKNQYITCIHNIHLDYADQERTKSDQEKVLKLAKSRNASIAVEDLAAYEGNNKEVIRYLDDIKKGTYDALLASVFKVNIKDSGKGCLPASTRDCAFGMIEQAQKLKIPTFNIEWRHVKDASTTPGYKISGKEVWNTFHQEIEKALSQTEDRAYLFYPALISKLLHKFESVIYATRHRQTSMQLLTLKFPELPAFGSELVDIRIAHAIEIFKNSNHIFIVAGDEHCKNIRPIFDTLGFTQVTSKILKHEPTGTREVTAEHLDLESYFKTLDEILQKEAHNKK